MRPFYSLYLTVMKVLFIGLTGFTVDMMRRQNPYKRTYDATQDTYLHIKYAVVPCAVLGFLVTLYRGFGILELFWNFSEFLEAVAILPQLIVLQRHKEVENLTVSLTASVCLVRHLPPLRRVALYFSSHLPFLCTLTGQLHLPHGHVSRPVHCQLDLPLRV